MKFIGITGGVGAGKSTVLAYLEKRPRTRVMLADEIAHRLMEPGGVCYDRILKCFPEETICRADGTLDRGALAAVLFSDERKREQVNRIVHPAVRLYVEEQLRAERAAGRLDLLVLEAALLVEEKYGAICDELWYIDTHKDIRRERLKRSRGYSDEKIDGIFASQLDEAAYRRACQVIIENNGSPDNTRRQVEKALQRL